MLSSRRAFLRSTTLFGCAALAAACTPAAPPVVPKPVSLKAAWVAKTANQMVWPLAKDAGYFDKYGISFELNYLNGSATAIAALFSKDLDVASVAGSAIVGAQAAGQDIIMVAGFLNQAVFRIMATDLQSIDDVKGKTVAVTRVGQADYYAWQTVMDHQKWSQNDVTFVNANDVPPNDVLASKIGAHLILDIATLEEPEQNVGMGVTREFLVANRPVVLNVIKASVEAMARWKTDPTFTKGVIQKYLESNDPQFSDSGYDAYGPLWPQAPYPSRDGMLRVIQQVTSQNPKAADLKVDQLMDLSVVKELEDSGFIEQIYGG